MLRDSVVVVVVVVRTRPRAIPLAMITMTKSTHGFPFVSHILDAYGAPLGGPSGRRSTAISGSTVETCYLLLREGLCKG